MQTDCNGQTYLFEPHFQAEKKKPKKVEASFDGGAMTSDAGGLLLREVDAKLRMTAQFAQCFQDHRRQTSVEHSVLDLLRQRVYGIALGYEDLIDHDSLRHDHLLATLVGKSDPTGQDRQPPHCQGQALAGKSTLNRLELTRPDAAGQDRYKKITACVEQLDRVFVDLFLQAHARAPKRIVLDVDATDDPLHGAQEGRFFHGYYDSYCYLPLYIFCGDFLLCARLRSSDCDGAEGVVEELDRIVGQIRTVWPQVEICVRGDSGFCREKLMGWCDQHRVDYILGLAKNTRLLAAVTKQMKKARRKYFRSGHAARVFRDFRYRTRKSWSRTRRVVGKAEYLCKGANPRFIVTSYAREVYDARTLYEQEYCIRGEMENRIKEQQLYLFADRTSTHYLHSNQLRLYFSCMAYVLIDALRREGLKQTAMARAQCGTIRLRLLKIGAQVRVSVRRIYVSMASGFPFQEIFHQAYMNLRRLRPVPG